MGSIRITEFGGIRPRDMRGSGPLGRASVARDIDLGHGSARPWRYPALSHPSEDKICAMFQMDCCIITSDNECADFATVDTNCGVVYSTNVMPWPAYAITPDCSTDCCNDCGQIADVEWHRLGVPAPENAPTIVGTPYVTPPSAAPNIDEGDQVKRESRAYYYTFVNELDQEGPPSEASTVVDADTDATVTLGFNIPPLPTGYKDPEYIRIYRAGSGFNNEGDWERASVEFFFVDEIPYQSGNFTHLEDVPAHEMGEVNNTDCHYPPMETLDNLVASADGTLIASEGKNVWFSEPWKPHAWSCHLNLDDCPKAMVVQGALLYVATNSYPYVIATNNPEEDCKCCRETNKITTPAPIFNKRSMVATHNGAIWASDVGLVRMTSGTISIDTHPYMAESDWQSYFPAQMHGAYHKGMYFGFNWEKGFIWDVNDSVHSNAYKGDSGKFTELSLTPDAVYSNDQNLLFMSFDDGIHEWNRSDVHMPYTWRSQLDVDGGLKNYSAMKVVFENWLRTKKSPSVVTMRLYVDDRLAFQRNVNCSRPFRLPKGYDGLNFEIEIQGTESVMEIHMATSMRELVLKSNA